MITRKNGSEHSIKFNDEITDEQNNLQKSLTEFTD